MHHRVVNVDRRWSYEMLQEILMIDQAIKAERKRIAERIKNIHVYWSSLPSSDPYSPYNGGQYLSKEDAEMLLSDIANAILGED
jgi:hypothetical protein